MNYHLDSFARAYQQELLRSTGRNPHIQTGLSKLEAHQETVVLREHLLSHLGTVLIDLGERMKGQDPCAELSHGRA